ncbi:MAG: substrate-binding domain-containing protein [Mycobacterium sp.]|nr:substrate-binding domain-containing protein [Mycobacterium sp.]
METSKLFQPTRRQVIAGGAASLGLLAAGCGSSATGGASGKGLRLFMVPKWTTLPYFESCKQGAQKAANELGDTLIYTGPSTPDPEQQVASLQNVLNERPDAILLSAIEPNNVAPVLKRAMARGTVVVTYDADSAPDARKLFCNQLSYQVAATSYLDAALMNNSAGGKCAFMAATPTTVNHMQQIAHMKSAMATIPKYKVFTPGNTYFVQDDATKSYNTMVDIMQSDPSVKFLLSGSAVSAPAAAHAIEATGHAGKVWATGAALPSLIKQYLQDGSEKAFVLWDTVNLGYMTAYAAHLIKTGKLKVSQGATFKAGNLGTFTIGAQNTANYDRPIIFTKQNIAQYTYIG